MGPHGRGRTERRPRPAGLGSDRSARGHAAAAYRGSHGSLAGDGRGTGPLDERETQAQQAGASDSAAVGAQGRRPRRYAVRPPHQPAVALGGLGSVAPAEPTWMVDTGTAPTTAMHAAR